MTAVATIIIPYAPYHLPVVQRAVQSAQSQTIECDVLAGPSKDTPAHWRNIGMEVDTPFVVFLDADDMLNSRFVEDCLTAYQEGQYVYTNWTEGGREYSPRDCAWSPQSHHIVTTLYPTAIFRALGGFDPDLIGHEDADFYMRSYSRGVCGVHVKKALVERPEMSGLRSRSFHDDERYNSIIADVVNRNGGLTKIMACCGNNQPIPDNPAAGQPGDVLAESLWLGMQSVYSPSTGRIYIGGNGNKLMVHPEDITALKTIHGKPMLREVVDLTRLAPKREEVLKDSGLL